MILPRISRAPAIAANGTSDDSDGPLLFGLGIHGQYPFVDAERQLVIAKVSSQELPLDAARITATLRVVSAVRRVLRSLKSLTFLRASLHPP